MRVELSVDLFPHPPSIVNLDAVAFLALQGRHRLFIADDTDHSFREWLEQLAPDHREEWELILSEAYEVEAREPAQRAIQVIRSGQPDWASNPPMLPLAAAVNFLQLPFLALLEDWHSDRAFLSAVASPEQRDYLEKMESRGALEFANGGGISNMPKRITALASVAGTNRRLWALFDGDGMRPGFPSRDSERLRESCEVAGVPFHQLSRRSIENYITTAALNSWAKGPAQNRDQRVRKVRALQRMKPDQRHHFNMKDGFAQDAKRTDDTAGTLFASIPPRDLTTLADGFGGHISALLRPDLISEGDLRAEESWEELSNMVSRLVDLVR